MSKLTPFDQIFKTITKADIEYSKIKFNISEAIISKRESLGMSQSQFAKYLGVSQPMVSKYENSEYNFSVEALVKLCDKLDLKLSIDIVDNNPYNQIVVYNPYITKSKNNNIIYSKNYAKAV